MLLNDDCWDWSSVSYYQIRIWSGSSLFKVKTLINESIFSGATQYGLVTNDRMLYEIGNTTALTGNQIKFLKKVRCGICHFRRITKNCISPY